MSVVVTHERVAQQISGSSAEQTCRNYMFMSKAFKYVFQDCINLIFWEILEELETS